VRRCRAALAALTLVLLTIAVAGPVQAGGPTSVLLVVPGAGQTAALYNSDADYEALAGLVGAYEPTGLAGITVDESGTSHESASVVNVTWLIHDVQVWRVDRVYFDTKGGPWISTQQSLDPTTGIWATPAVWHTASDSKKLSALFDRIGVTRGPGGAGGAAVTGGTADGGSIGTSSAPSAAASAAADSKLSVDKPADPRTPGSKGAVWGLAGLALGAVIAVVAMRLSLLFRQTGKQATEEPGAGGSSDLPDARHRSDDELEWSASEELSWPAQRR
jgi:hypothetical protein